MQPSHILHSTHRWFCPPCCDACEWLERSFSFSIGPHQLRGRVDRVDQLQDGGYELIDYKTGERRAGPGVPGPGR